jgi:hypothetical protein
MASAASPSTPPPQRPSPSILSSPVVRVPKFYNEHKRDEFQAFGYDVKIHEPEGFKNLQDFFNFLGVQDLRVRNSDFNFTLSDFTGVANAMSKAIMEKRKHTLFLGPSC